MTTSTMKTRTMMLRMRFRWHRAQGPWAIGMMFRGIRVAVLLFMMAEALNPRGHGMSACRAMRSCWVSTMYEYNHDRLYPFGTSWVG